MLLCKYTKHQLWLLRVYQIYSAILGVTSYDYNFHTYAVEQTKFRKFLALFLNMAVYCFIIFLITSQFKQFFGFEWNSLVGGILSVSLPINALFTALTLLTRSKREKSLAALLNDIILIERKFLKSYASNQDLQKLYDTIFKLIFYVNFYLNVFVVIGITMFNYAVQEEWSVTLIYFLFGNIHNITKMTSISYFGIILDILRVLKCVNYDFETLIRAGNSQESVTPKEFEDKLDDLIAMYWTLSKVVNDLNDVFLFQMFYIRFESFLCNIVSGYFAYVCWHLSDISLWFALIVVLSPMLFTLHLLLIDWLSELVVEEFHSTIFILKHLEHDSFSKQIKDQMLEVFSLNMCGHKTEITICTFIKINRSSWFQLVGKIVTFIVVLLQFHLTLKDVKVQVPK